MLIAVWQTLSGRLNMAQWASMSLYMESSALLSLSSDVCALECARFSTMLAGEDDEEMKVDSCAP
jgi:hypothetical protein